MDNCSIIHFFRREILMTPAADWLLYPFCCIYRNAFGLFLCYRAGPGQTRYAVQVSDTTMPNIDRTLVTLIKKISTQPCGT